MARPAPRTVAVLLLLVTAVAAAATVAAAARGAAEPADPPPAAPPADDPRPAPPAVTPLRPYTAFAWVFPGLHPHVKPMYVLSRNTPPGVAAQATARMPAGSRVVLTTDFVGGMLDHPADACVTADGKPAGHPGVWPTVGPRLAAEAFDAYLRDFAQVGGQIDLLALDFEGNQSCWGMSEARLAAVAADPRFKDLAPRLGFDDVLKAMPQNSTARGEYLRWNAVMDRAVADALDQAMLVPLRRHFPRAGMSNFDGVALSPDHVVPELNGHLQYRLGEPAGTHQSPAIYGGILAAHSVPGVNWERPFVQVVYAANLCRAAGRSSRRPIVPWVAPRGFKPGGGPGRSSFWGGTDYWQEGMYHALLSGGTTNLLYWNPGSSLKPPLDRTDTDAAHPADNDALEAVMADVEREAGGQPVVATATAEPVAWDPPVLVSAATLADGATLARVTFSEKLREATVTVAGRPVKVTRPAGKLGVWVRVERAGPAKRN